MNPFQNLCSPTLSSLSKGWIYSSAHGPLTTFLQEMPMATVSLKFSSSHSSLGCLLIFFFFGGGRGLELPIVSSVHSLWTSLLEIKGLKPKDSTDLSDVRQLVGDSARLKLKSWIPYQASCRYIGNQMVSEERWPSESCLRSPADVS